jgi:hypothetical protein
MATLARGHVPDFLLAKSQSAAIAYFFVAMHHQDWLLPSGGYND